MSGAAIQLASDKIRSATAGVTGLVDPHPAENTDPASLPVRVAGSLENGGIAHLFGDIASAGAVLDPLTPTTRPVDAQRGPHGGSLPNIGQSAKAAATAGSEWLSRVKLFFGWKG